jgi:Holliday junction resolvasome RuvABC endonuclease subunit
MRILAIDPASNKCGIARFNNGVLIETRTLISNAKTPLFRRLDIAFQLAPFIVDADAVVSEEPFLKGKNNNGMQRLLGMIEKVTNGHVYFYHPLTVKKSLGSGSLDKLEVALASGEKLQFQHEQEILAEAIRREAFDETDAVAIGLTHFAKEKLVD